MLRRLVERETAEGFDLTNRVTIEIHTASFKAVRGCSMAAALCDEVAFWPQEDSATPDAEILAALRPGLASIPGSMLLCASSPHAKRGELWNAYRRWHAQDGAPVLTWQADTRTMNPGISADLIADAYERDPSRAAAEYGAQFRNDVETFVSREVVEACVSPGVFERSRTSRDRYAAFCDPSGGSSDSMTLCIGHAEGRTVVIDFLRETRAPFSPEAVVADFSRTLASYGVRRVVGDKYAGVWPEEAFKRHGVTYESSAAPKSDLYRDLLPKLNSGEVDLLDNPRLVAQLCGLERRTARGGRDSIDHSPGAHDDIANAVAGLVASAAARPRQTSAVIQVRGLG